MDAKVCFVIKCGALYTYIRHLTSRLMHRGRETHARKRESKTCKSALTDMDRQNHRHKQTNTDTGTDTDTCMDTCPRSAPPAPPPHVHAYMALEVVPMHDVDEDTWITRAEEDTTFWIERKTMRGDQESVNRNVERSRTT